MVYMTGISSTMGRAGKRPRPDQICSLRLANIKANDHEANAIVHHSNKSLIIRRLAWLAMDPRIDKFRLHLFLVLLAEPQGRLNPALPM
jgi:hypothetical protein